MLSWTRSLGRSTRWAPEGARQGSARRVTAAAGPPRRERPVTSDAQAPGAGHALRVRPHARRGRRSARLDAAASTPMASPFADRSGDHAMNSDRAVGPTATTSFNQDARTPLRYPPLLVSAVLVQPARRASDHPRDSLTAYPIDRHNRSIGRMWIRSSNVKERSPVENATPATKRCPKASRSLRSPASSLPATR